LIVGLSFRANSQALIYTISSGQIHFNSNAPKELIDATSNALAGVVDLEHKTFAFKIDVRSFAGFNSPLQREHFNENYMETPKFPEAVFSGKIIEDVDLSKEGSYNVRAKGKLQIHGMQQERIIRATVTNKGGKIKIQTDFTVSLADHDIKIPRVVYEKLAPDINVSVKATLSPRK
jgi:polyisoprenoid-binding protein YceI